MCIENLRKGKSTSSDGILERIEEMVKQNTGEKYLSLKQFPTSAASKWIVPTSISELTNALKEVKSFKIVSGATSDEFWKSVKETPPLAVIDVTKVKEMRCVECSDGYLKLGASLTVSEMQKEIQALIDKLPENKTKLLKALMKMIDVYGSGQVRRSAVGQSLIK